MGWLWGGFGFSLDFRVFKVFGEELEGFGEIGYSRDGCILWWSLFYNFIYII